MLYEDSKEVLLPATAAAHIRVSKAETQSQSCQVTRKRASGVYEQKVPVRMVVSSRRPSVASWSAIRSTAVYPPSSSSSALASFRSAVSKPSVNRRFRSASRAPRPAYLCLASSRARLVVTRKLRVLATMTV